MNTGYAGIIISALFALSLNSAEPSPLAGSLARISGSPYEKLNGKQARVVGNSQEVWGIEDIWLNKDSWGIPAILKYLATQPPLLGAVYYGKVGELGYCFHESWLHKDTTQQPEESAEKMVSATTNGTIIVGPESFIDFLQNNSGHQK